MDEHFDALNASEIEEEYWGARQSQVELSCSPTDAEQDQSDDALTLPNIEMHQDYWGDDVGYVLFQYSTELSNPEPVSAKLNSKDCKCQLCSSISTKFNCGWSSFGSYNS